MSKIDKTKIGDSWYYDLECIADSLGVGLSQKFHVYGSQTGKDVHIVDERWAEGKGFIKFLSWYGNNCDEVLETPVFFIARAIKKDYEHSRSTSRKHKWDIAYRQQYKCGVCQSLLHPKSFDIDHVVPLFRGGHDSLSNLQALCCNCHAVKSRTERSAILKT